MLVVLAVAAGAWAGRVSEQQARAKAVAFMAGFAKTRGASALTRVYLPLDTKSSIWSTTDAPLYIYNNEGGGYVIVSGDDRTSSVLCFSEKGHVDANHLPVNMKSWLQGYVSQIENIPASATQHRVATTRSGEPKAAIEPKLATNWGQDYPYNLHTPELTFRWTEDKDSTLHAATGCVATAMAMVLNYFKYPDKILCDIPSYTGTCDIPVKNGGTGVTDTVKNVRWITEDIPAGTPIDWSNIVDKYGQWSTDAQREAVSRLIQYCGAAVNMGYGIESMSTSRGLLLGIKNVMGYQDAYVLNAFEYDYQGWVDAVYYEMSNVGPVMFAGTIPSGGGHRFILDGYLSADGNDYFYANWGWDGSDNCYVLLSVMEPESQWIRDENGNPEGFIFEQDMICGLGPDGKGCTTMTDFRFYANALDFGLEGKEYSRSDKSEEFGITDYYIEFSNNHLDSLTARAALGVYDANNNLVYRTIFTDVEGFTINFFCCTILANAGTFPIAADLDDGTYTLKLICAEPNTDNWVPMQNAENFTVQMTITGNKCTFKPAGDATAIRSVVANPRKASADDAWYSLSGARLSSKPTTKGVYFHQGSKVVVK